MSYRLFSNKKKWLTDNELHGLIYTFGDFPLDILFIFRTTILTNARPTLSNYWRGD